MTNPPVASGTSREFEVVAYPAAARAAVAVLECGSKGVLLVLAAWFVGLLPFLGDFPLNTLKMMRIFSGCFLAPEALAWMLRSGFAGRARVEGGDLRIARRDMGIAVPLDSVVGVEAWTLPLPRGGVTLRLRSGRPFSPALQVADPAGLVGAMVEGGASPSIATGLAGPMGTYAAARLASPHGRLEHPVLKFVVYSLVPAVPVFRLYQYITFGGTFGEYYTFGLKAYLIAFGLWWLSYAMGLVILAAAIRAGVEVAALAGALLAPSVAAGTRRFLEGTQRALFYVGMPLLLAIRLLA